MKKKYKCKYCGKNTVRSNICSNCADKLKRVRRLQYIGQSIKQQEKK